METFWCACPVLERCTKPCLCGHHTTWMYLTTHTTHLCVHTAHSCAQYVWSTHRCLCVGNWTATCNWSATCNGTKILTQCSVAHIGQRCLHTTQLCPCHHEDQVPWAMADIYIYPTPSQFDTCFTLKCSLHLWCMCAYHTYHSPAMSSIWITQNIYIKSSLRVNALTMAR